MAAWSLEPDLGLPRKELGESDAAYQRRRAAAIAAMNQIGVVREVGMPPATSRFAPSATGERLGDFVPRSAAGLPSPNVGSSGAVVSPGGHPDPLPFPSPPMGGAAGIPPGPVGPFFAPGGAVALGMRTPFDEAPEDRRRREILQATHYDAEWGSPPAAGEGLVWSDERFLYEPTSDENGAPYRAPSRLHAWPVYVQASWDSDFSRWRTRWVEASTTLPDPARPYRVLSTGETRTADAAVAAERGRIVDLATVKESGYSGFDKPIVIPQHLLRPTPKATYDWTDYVWVSQHQLPVGCPYPAYAHMPVPKADYLSGDWRSPDYSPSIPLPPGYPAWRCGVEGTEGKPHKGGGGKSPEVPLPPTIIETVEPEGGAGSLGRRSDVGLPLPGGIVAQDAPKRPPSPARPDPRPVEPCSPIHTRERHLVFIAAHMHEKSAKSLAQLLPSDSSFGEFKVPNPPVQSAERNPTAHTDGGNNVSRLSNIDPAQVGLGLAKSAFGGDFAVSAEVITVTHRYPRRTCGTPPKVVQDTHTITFVIALVLFPANSTGTLSKLLKNFSLPSTIDGDASTTKDFIFIGEAIYADMIPWEAVNSAFGTNSTSFTCSGGGASRSEGIARFSYHTPPGKCAAGGASAAGHEAYVSNVLRGGTEFAWRATNEAIHDIARTSLGGPPRVTVNGQQIEVGFFFEPMPRGLPANKSELYRVDPLAPGRLIPAENPLPKARMGWPIVH